MDQLIMAADAAWLYHDKAKNGDMYTEPESHDLILDPHKEWCVTHRPAKVCPCGQYTLEWQA